MHIHSLKRAAVAACVLAALAAVPAAAAPATTKLRVEAGGHDLGPGWRYVHDSVTYATSKSKACGGTGAEATIDGPSALGLLFHGQAYNGDITPVQVSDKFEFGPFVCGIGEYESSDASYWLYKVDHVAPEVGADKFPIGSAHREVLWYFVDSAAGINTGNELGLVVEDRDVEAGAAVQVQVAEYGFDGRSTPAEGVRLLGGDGAVTDANGQATLVFERAGKPVIRGARGSDIPTDGIRLCVWEDSAGECGGVAHSRVVGTDGADTIKGGPERERIEARRGRDRITSRDGRRDTVYCGRGRDTLRADHMDRVGRDCERVVRR